LLSFIKASRL